MPYQDLGNDHCEKLNRKHLERALVRRIEKLGDRIMIQPLAAAA